MTILAPHFCTQQTVTLNDTNPSKYLSRLGYSLYLVMFMLLRFKGLCNVWTLTDPGYLNSVTLET